VLFQQLSLNEQTGYIILEGYLKGQNDGSTIVVEFTHPTVKINQDLHVFPPCNDYSAQTALYSFAANKFVRQSCDLTGFEFLDLTTWEMSSIGNLTGGQIINAFVPQNEGILYFSYQMPDQQIIVQSFDLTSLKVLPATYALPYNCTIGACSEFNSIIADANSVVLMKKCQIDSVFPQEYLILLSPSTLQPLADPVFIPFDDCSFSEGTSLSTTDFWVVASDGTVGYIIRQPINSFVGLSQSIYTAYELEFSAIYSTATGNYTYAMLTGPAPNPVNICQISNA